MKLLSISDDAFYSLEKKRKQLGLSSISSTIINILKNDNSEQKDDDDFWKI